MSTAVETAPRLEEPRENLTRVVWELAWPAVALNSLQVVNSLLDRGFIGHLEPAALTAHGAAMGVIFFFFSLAAAIGTAATALVSRAFGAGDSREVRAASRQCVNISLLGGALMVGVGLLAIDPFRSFLLPADDPRAAALMSQFLVIYMLGLPATYLVQSLAGSLRGIGDTKSPMVISGVQIVLHILLNYVLIFPSRPVAMPGGWSMFLPGAGMGLAGAALALTLSAWLSGIAYLLWTGKTPLGPVWRVGIPLRAWATRILRIATPAAGNAVLRVGAFMVFTAILAQTPNGSVAIAAMSVGIAIESIMFMPAFGLAMATSALVGQSLGSRRPERAERVGWLAGHHGALVMVALSLPIFLGSDWIAAVMVSSPGTDPETLLRVTQTREAAAEYIRWMCATQALVGYAMVLIGALQGAGDTVRPVWITVLSMILLRAPLAWVLALPMGMGATGAWIAMTATQGLQGVMAMVAFREGSWKTKKV